MKSASRALARLNNAFRRVGYHFTLDAVDNLYMPFIAGTDPGAVVPDPNESGEFLPVEYGWDDVRDDLARAYPVPTTLPDPSMTATLKGWISAAIQGYGDDNVLQLWVHPDGSRLNLQLDGYSKGEHPQHGSLALISETTARNGGYLMEHEVGHYFGLPHTFDEPSGHHPDTGEQAEWRDLWDLYACDLQGVPVVFDSYPNEIAVENWCPDGPELIDQTDNCSVIVDRVYCYIDGHLRQTGDAELRGQTTLRPLSEPHDVPDAFRYTINAMSYRTHIDNSPPTQVATHFSEAQAQWIQAFGSSVSYPIVPGGKRDLLIGMGFSDPRTQRGHLGWYTTDWRDIEGGALDIAAGGDGSVWKLNGAAGNPYRFNYETSVWDAAGTLVGERIAVAGENDVWIIRPDRRIFRRAGSTWVQQPGKGIDIAGGRSLGIVWLLAKNGTPHYWNGFGWTSVPGITGTKIAVAERDTPWVIEDGTGAIHRLESGQWVQKPGYGRDIAASGNGDVWVIGRGSGSTFMWDGLTEAWVYIADHPATSLAVDDWGVPWAARPSDIWARR